jgi:hypothetical protein
MKKHDKDIYSKPLPFEYAVVEEGPKVTARGGLPLVLETMRALGVSSKIDSLLPLHGSKGFGAAKMVEAFVLLLAAGGDCVDDMESLRSDEALCALIDSKFPSATASREFLYSFHSDDKVNSAAESAKRNDCVVVPQETDELLALRTANKHLVREVAARKNFTKATLDFDATIIESHKREAQWHYKEGRGYQPAIAVWAEADLVVFDEFRDGNVPNQKDVREQVRTGFAALPEEIAELYMRADSAYYQVGLLEMLEIRSIQYSISADMNESLRDCCVALPEANWQLLESRGDEDVHIAKVTHIPTDWNEALKKPRFVALRITPKQGKLFDEGYGPKYLAVVSNRTELTPQQLVKWHWEKAGTVEHVHGVCKNELGAGTLPCGRFQANAAWFRLNMLTYNILSAFKSICMNDEALQKARPKKLRFHVLNVPVLFSTHARQFLAKCASWLKFADKFSTWRSLLWLRPKTLAFAA